MNYQRHLERLSSGLRINSAKDDAAGLRFLSALRLKSRVLIKAHETLTMVFRWRRPLKARLKK